MLRDVAQLIIDKFRTNLNPAIDTVATSYCFTYVSPLYGIDVTSLNIDKSFGGKGCHVLVQEELQDYLLSVFISSTK
jgi:hypothetical protein